METITMTKEDWEAKGTGLFGKDQMKWRFKCPSCGFVASVEDWQKVGAPQAAVAYSCIGRYTGSTQEFGSKQGGPCNYTTGGLFNISPVRVTDNEEHEWSCFAFDGDVS